jgi:MarR family transcriptional regulator, organic hydroperoxide resistance regulator
MLRDVRQPPWLANLDLHSPTEELTALLAALVPVLEQRFVRVCTDLGLNRAQAQLLAQLPSDLVLSQREMSQRLHCAPSSIVGLIDSLEERGWLARQVDRADRRINVLVLTPDGRQLREQLMQRLLDPPAAIRRLPAEAQEELRTLLRELLEELGAPPTDACT